MPWKSRQGRPAYFRSRRDGGRVVSEWVGAGVLGQLAELLDRAERDRRAADEQAWRLERAGLDEADRAAAAGLRATLAAVWAALGAAGWHRTRGEVRMASKPRPSEPRSKVPAVKAPSLPATAPAPFVVDPTGVIPSFTIDEITSVVERAQDGDESAVPRLRQLLKLDRDRAIWGCSGDFPETLRSCIIDRHAGQNLAMRLAATAKINDLRSELSGPNPSAIEKLLIDQIIVGWLEVYTLDIRYQLQGPVSLAQQAHAMKLRGRAQAHYLRSLRALASVRRLPAQTLVQVAVGPVRVGGADGQVPPAIGGGGLPS